MTSDGHEADRGDNRRQLFSGPLGGVFGRTVMVGTDARNWGSELVVRILVLYFRLGRFSFIFFTKKNTRQNPRQNLGQFFGAPFGACFHQFLGVPLGIFSSPGAPSVALGLPSIPVGPFGTPAVGMQTKPPAKQHVFSKKLP